VAGTLRAIVLTVALLGTDWKPAVAMVETIPGCKVE